MDAPIRGASIPRAVAVDAQGRPNTAANAAARKEYPNDAYRRDVAPFSGGVAGYELENKIRNDSAPRTANPSYYAPASSTPATAVRTGLRIGPRPGQTPGPASNPGQPPGTTPVTETYDATRSHPKAVTPAVDTLGRAPTSFVPGALLFQNQQFFKVNALGQPEHIQTIV